jgi:ubiquinone/menaquinone biosynthesis C-methylase UbiE
MDSAPGFYAGRVFPWLNDHLTQSADLGRLRTEALAHAAGHVLEIGFGTGLNLEHYPPGVRDLVAIEPNPGMLVRAEDRLAQVVFPVHVINGSAEELPFADGAFDTAVSTLTLCTVPDPARALGELRRVLRDEGQLLLMEHGLAEDPGVARWQERLDWLQTRVGCGCHLNRDVLRIARDQGFRFETLRQLFVPRTPRTHGWVTLALARKAPLH